MDKSKKIYDWLRERPLIKANKLATLAGIDSGNFSRKMQEGRPIPDHYITAMEQLLKPYGYK